MSQAAPAEQTRQVKDGNHVPGLAMPGTRDKPWCSRELHLLPGQQVPGSAS